MRSDVDSRGFSLVELLAALAIFAVLAVMTQHMLTQTLTTETRLSAHRAELVGLQRGVALITRDLENIVPHGIRGSDGSAEPFLVLSGGRTLIFTRGGLPNPAVLPRSGFQRIRYTLASNGQGIERRVLAQHHHGAGHGPAVRVFLDDAGGVRFRVWTRGSGWRDSWPDSEDPESRNRLPDGIEASLETRRFGAIRRVVSVR